MKITKAAALTSAACVLVGIVLGLYMRDIIGGLEENIPRAYSEEHLGGYQFINPLLGCDISSDVIRSKELKRFEGSVKAFVEGRIADRSLESASVYFRELNDGIWFSVGEVTELSPVSLLKVPLMIAVFKQAERTPEFLSRKVRYDRTADFSSMQRIKPARQLMPGEYRVEELVSQMITYSDNNAFTLLEGLVDPQVYKKVYSDLGIQMAYMSKPDYRISSRRMASFFRVLYNASYLSRDMSEKALQILSGVAFKSGIVAGVPGDVIVAHKFGEGGDNAAAELHDCGIVYYPIHPYLLCIMTRGGSYENLNDTIASISQMIYQEIDRQHQNHEHQRQAGAL